MNGRTFGIIGTVFSVIGTGLTAYSIIENEGIKFNLNTLLFVSLIVIGLIFIIVYATRKRRTKEFSYSCISVKAIYSNHLYLTITNISEYTINNISVKVNLNQQNYTTNLYPYIINPSSFSLKPFNSSVKDINTNGYKKSFDVTIKWNGYRGNDVFVITL